MSTCSVCNGTHNSEGIRTGLLISRYLKQLLGLRSDHPFPLRFEGLLASCLALGQAVAAQKAHSLDLPYLTTNPTLLRFRQELHSVFAIRIFDQGLADPATEVIEVCEFMTALKTLD